MLLNYDPTTSLRHYPIPNMARFGTTPFGDNLYRIVFAPTRLRMIQGTWATGETCAQWRPAYRDVGDAWILERWLPANEFAKGKTIKEWDEQCGVLGPYPSRGEYELCFVFEACGPSDANLEKLVSWVEEGRKRSFQDHRDACMQEYQQEEKDTSRIAGDRLRNAMSAFLDAPMSGYGGGRGSKTANFDIAAHSLPLPIGNNKLVSL